MKHSKDFRLLSRTRLCLPFSERVSTADNMFASPSFIHGLGPVFLTKQILQEIYVGFK